MRRRRAHQNLKVQLALRLTLKECSERVERRLDRPGTTLDSIKAVSFSSNGRTLFQGCACESEEQGGTRLKVYCLSASSYIRLWKTRPSNEPFRSGLEVVDDNSAESYNYGHEFILRRIQDGKLLE
mmetsp:Transcript_21924/g.89156  ORF Transcript_21924/g.89156 Transcript_21924/m.89156 type:complete len:126 (-) Transcript_21924:1057-1434(-)